MRHSLLLPTAQYLEHGQSGAPIIGLIKVTASSILEVVILSSVGFVLARRGIIDKRTQTKINKLNVSFFTPALLFSKVAFTLNPARLAELFIVPLGFVIVTVVSTLSALVLSWSAKLSPAQRNFAIACAISPNSNSLPVALMQSLVVTVPQLHWDEQGEPEDTVDGMLGRALTYLVLFSTLGMFLRWSVGAKLLSSVEEDTSPEDSIDAQGHPSPSSTISDTDTQHPRPQITLRRPTGERVRPERKRSGPPAWARSFPNSPDASMTNSRARGGDDSDSDVEDEPLEPYEEEGQITLPGASNSRENRSCWKRFSTATRKWFHNLVLRPLYAIGGFMTAPLYAAVISLVVAVIPPLQKFIDSLEPVVGALETAGACSIPLTMVVLGAYFVADASAVQQAQGSIPKAVPPSAPAGDGSMSATGPQPTAPSSSSKSFNGNAAGSDSDDPWRRTSLESASASGESTLVQAKDSKRKGLSSWNPWNSGSSSGGSDIEEGGGRYTEEPSSYAQAAAPSSTPISRRVAGDDEAARNADLNSRNSAGRFQNALNKQASDSTMERRTIAVAISSRMILTPLILLPFVAWYAMATASNVMDDPVFVACACLIIGSPPALTLAQITSQSAQGNPSFERLISRTIFTAYTFLAAPTTILLVLTALVITENDKNKG